MPRLRDLVADDIAAHERELSPRALAVLDMPLPDGLPEGDVAAIAKAVRSRLPYMTIAATNPMLSAHRVATAERFPRVANYEDAARRLAYYQSQPAIKRLAGQAGAGAAETLPSISLQPGAPNRTPNIPTAQTFPEKLARTAGSVLAFGTEAGAILSGGAALGLGLTAAGGPTAAAGAIAAGLPAAAQQGTVKERLVRGGVMAASSGLSHGLGILAAPAGKAAQAAAEIGGGAAIFGGAAPYAEAAALKATGEDVQMPHWQDVLEGMGQLGIVNALTHGAGSAARGMSRGRAEIPAAATETAPSAAETPTNAASVAPARPRLNLSGDGYKVAQGVARGLDENRTNRLDKGRTERQGFVDRLAERVTPDTPPEKVRSIAAQARKEVLGLRVLRDATDEPPGGTPPQKAASEAATARWNEYLGGKGITFKGEDGKAYSGRVALVLNYPWAEKQMRVILVDEHTGQTAAAMFSTPQEFTNRVLAINRAVPTEQPAKPKPTSAQLELGKPSEGTEPPAGGKAAAPKAPTRPRATVLEASDEAKASAAARAVAKQYPDAEPKVVERRGRFVVEVNADVQVGKEEPKGGPVTRSAPEREVTPAPQAPSTARGSTKASERGSRAPEGAVAAPASEKPAGGEPAGARPAEGTAPPEAKPPANFFDTFSELVKKGRAPEEARVEAEKIGGAAPAGFDAETRAKSIIARAAEEKGQTSMFGAPEAPAVRGGEPVAPERKVEGAPQPIEGPKAAITTAGETTRPGEPKDLARPRPEAPARTESRTERAQSLHFHEAFQQRDLETGVIDREHIQNLLERAGGFNRDEVTRDPITTWRDAKGEIGPEGRVYVISGHHRTYLAQHDWERGKDNRFFEKSLSDREVPTVEFKGTYQEALTEAETSNLRGKPNTMVEKSGVARRLLDRGVSMEQIARDVTGGKAAEAQHLINLSYLAPDLQRSYFGEKGLPLTVGSYLGEFANRYKVHPEHQRPWLQRLEDGRIATRQDLEAQVEGYLKIMKAANQTSLLGQMDMGENAISPATAMDYLGKVMNTAARARREAAAAVRTVNKTKAKGLNPEEENAAEVLMKRHQRELAHAIRIEKEAERRALKAVTEATSKGKKIADALYEVKLWIEKQEGPGPPAEWGGTSIFSDAADVTGRMVSRMVRGGIRRATMAAVEHLGKRTTSLRVEDRKSGKLIHSEPIEFIDDEYTNSAIVRMTSRLLKIGRGTDVMPPRLAKRWAQSEAEHSYHEENFRRMWEEAMGSKEALNYFAEYGSGAKELGRALSGKEAHIPEQFLPVVDRVKRMYQALDEMRAAHAERIGEERPASRQDYGFPHIVEGQRASSIGRVYSIVEARKQNEIADAELDDIHSRFYERRVGDVHYSEDATAATAQYFREMARKFAFDPYLKDAEQYLQSESVVRGGGAGAAKPQGEAQRAAMVRDFIRSRLFQRKGNTEQAWDEAARRVYFARVTQGSQSVPLEFGAKFTGITEQELALRGVKKVVWIPPNADVRVPESWQELKRATDGGRYVGGAEGVVMGNDIPVMNPLVQAMMDLTTDKWMRLKTLNFRNSESRLRHNGKVNEYVQRLARDPAALTIGWWTGANSRALLGWNIGAANVNFGGTIVTTLPEYGVRAYLDGFRAATRSAQQGALRNVVDVLEWRKLLSAEDAADARKMLPFLREEVFAEATGSSQGEVQKGSRRLTDLMEGRDPQFQKLMRLVTDGHTIFAAVEGWNRTLAIIAAESHALRMGLERRSPDIYDSMLEARKQMMQHITDQTSTESYATMGVLTDQFGYNPLGQPLYFGSPMGKALFQFGTWPLNYLMNYGVRPVRGALRVGAAAARGAVDVASGGRLGTKKIKDLPFVQRANHPAPRDWFQRWLESNGAGYSERHAAAVFVRQLAVSAVLLGVTDLTGFNVAVYGIPPHFVVGMWLLRQFFRDDEDIKRWYEEARYGAAVSLGRGIVPWGPTASLAFDAYNQFVRGASRADKEGPMAVVPWDAILTVVRRSLVGGEAQIKRLLQTHPEAFAELQEHFDIYGLFGVKTVYPDLTPAQEAKVQLRMMTEHESKVERRRVKR